MRAFFRAEPGTVGRMADRLIGSPQIYAYAQREPEKSINFITCHDGFTLNDLVSFENKHNEANGEDNRDGANDNRSWNCGVEGPSADPAIERLRNRQIKNFLTVTMLSIGIPMILMGDEVRRTQRGNNNAYCQDNDISWFDWSLVERHADMHRFVTMLNARRVSRDVEHEVRRLTLNQVVLRTARAWHGVRVGQPDWGHNSHSLAIEVDLWSDGVRGYVILNAYWEPLDFELPQVGDAKAGRWHRWIDTALDSPHDIVPWLETVPVSDASYRAHARSVAVLLRQADRGRAE
jgi:glycogen operon protein